MEPVTHVLTGACLARTGLNRTAAYATLAMCIGAEFPDIDTLWGLGGPVDSFQHHRGITHTFLGVPFEAALIVALIYAWYVWRKRRHARASNSVLSSRPAAAPVRWGVLYLLTLLALLSHLLLDWTNNYGLRPFFPFNPRWYAASIMFIFDPLMFLLLLGALVAPSIFRLVSSEVGARRQPFAARGWAVAALCGVVFLWTFREVQHNHALALAMSQTLAYVPQHAPDIPTPDSSGPAPDQPTALLQAQRALANPDPLTPFRWWTVTDFGPAYQLGQADTKAGTLVPGQQTQPKPVASAALRAAESTQLGRAYLDWSPIPYINVTQLDGPQASRMDDESIPASAVTAVTFRDPRFMGDIPGMHGRTPLSGRVLLDARDHVVQQSMDGKVQK